MAVFPSLPVAEEAASDLRARGMSEGQISIRTRTMTDDPAAARVAPAVDAPTRRRDQQVVGRVFTKIVVLAAAVAAAGALVAFLLTLALGASATLIVIATVVGAVAGSVVGGVWGGVLGSMTEAQKEEGVVLWARSDRRATAEEALRTLRARDPLRVDTYDGQGKPIAIG